MHRQARWSRCRRHRTALIRRWVDDLSPIGFIGLNPSTADHRSDDPTVRRCIGFARREGAGGLVLVNLFSWRATRPADLWAATERNCASSDRVMREELSHCALIIACWGAIPRQAHPRAARVRAQLDRLNATVKALGFTAAGHPRHPLYLRRDQPLLHWPASGHEA